MFKEILNTLIRSAESSFIEVTVFVGAVLLLFEYINFVQAGGLIRKIEDSKKMQPIIGALLGLTPGCGGAIFVIPLFPKGTVTFGTVVATLIATMGDAAFVLLTALPFHYLAISALSLVIGVIVGYLVDMTNLGPRLLKDYNEKQLEKEIVKKSHFKEDHSIILSELGGHIDHIGHEEGDSIDMVLHHDIQGHQEIGTLGYKFTHTLYPVFWSFIIIGLILGIMDLFQIDLNNLFIPNLGTIIGVLGTTISILTMVMSNKFTQNHTHEESELKKHDLKETIIHSAQETAFVATWVFLAYFAYELFVLALGKGIYVSGELKMAEFLTQQGLTAVIIGALIGIIPGCGPQIIFVTLFTKGLIPFSALLANAISQDGDALFPLIAIHKKSALWSVILNTLAGLGVGLIAYFLEFNIFI